MYFVNKSTANILTNTHIKNGQSKDGVSGVHSETTACMPPQGIKYLRSQIYDFVLAVKIISFKFTT